MQSQIQYLVELVVVELENLKEVEIEYQQYLDKDISIS